MGASGGIAIGPAYLTELRISVAERRILRHDRDAELARLATRAPLRTIGVDSLDRRAFPSPYLRRPTRREIDAALVHSCAI
jgi:hypothetical protein